MSRQQFSQCAIGLFVLAIATVVPSSASAQPRWGSAAVPREGVCFYRDANFRGEYFCARPGEAIPTLPPGTNDSVSSIRLFGPVEVMVFKDIRFRGPSARFVTDVRDLRREGWNDLISSARVTPASPPSAGWRPGGGPEWGNNQPIPREGACFYKDVGFRGPYFCVPRGGSYELVPRGFNDQISSIRVRGANVMIFADRDFGGRATRINGDVPNLRQNWSDQVSSVRVF